MKKQPHKIVVGVDSSPESEIAAQQALAIARHVGAEVVLVHAGTTVELPALSSAPSDSARRALEHYREALALRLSEAREEIGAMREALSGQGTVISQLLVEDFPAQALCTVAAELGARLMVVGTHGRTGLSRFRLGSVAQSVVRHSQTDVLVARRSRSSQRQFHRILVASDFSASAERALDAAVALASHPAHIDVVHFVAVPPMYHGGLGMLDGMPGDLRQALADDLRHQGEVIVQKRRRPGVELRVEVERTPPAIGILHRLEREQYDLVALGSHGRRGIRRALLGSVAESVVQRAPCSVLVARGNQPLTRSSW